MPQERKASVRRTPVQQRSRQLRAAIMEAAHGVMRDRGVRAITTNAIAAQAGIKVASIYDYFANKEDIVAELYRDKSASFRKFLEAETAAVERPNWRHQIAQLIRNTWTYQLSIGFDRTVVDAAYYFEELFGIAQAHANLFALIYARMLERIGSKWEREALVDLGVSLYTLVNATWSYWRVTESDRATPIDRQIQLSIALISQALPDDGTDAETI